MAQGLVALDRSTNHAHPIGAVLADAPDRRVVVARGAAVGRSRADRGLAGGSRAGAASNCFKPAGVVDAAARGRQLAAEEVPA